MSSKIRLFHACPQTQYLDCYCGSQPICQSTNYCGCTEYCEIDYGSHNVIVCQPQNQYRPLVDAYAYLPDAGYHTAIATGCADDMNLFIVPDAYTPMGSNKACVRFVNLAYDAPCLDLRFMDGAFVIANNIQYKEVTQYYPVTPSTYRMQACLCNTNHVVLTASSVTLQAGCFYTIYITGSVYQQPQCCHTLCTDGRYPNVNISPNPPYPFPTPSLPSRPPNYYPDYGCNTCQQPPWGGGCNSYPDYNCSPCQNSCSPISSCSTCQSNQSSCYPTSSCSTCQSHYYPDQGCSSCQSHSYPSGCSCGSAWTSDAVTYGSSYTHYYSDDCCTREQKNTD